MAFTTLWDESTNPFVSDSRTPDWDSVLVSLTPSSGGKTAEEGVCEPNLLVKREKADAPAFPVCGLSCPAPKDCENFNAQVDMPEVDSADEALFALLLSFPETAGTESWTSTSLAGSWDDLLVDSESIMPIQHRPRYYSW